MTLKRLLVIFPLSGIIAIGLVLLSPLQAWPQTPPPGPAAPVSMLPTREPAPPITTPDGTATPAVVVDLPTAEPTATQYLPPSPTPRQPAEGFGPRDFPAHVNPLTGLAVSDPSLLERRPMAIKITNFPRPVRPQWGLSLADVVFEYYLEHGLTRFIALFYGNDAPRVGPVRSARFFDEHIFRMYQAIFTFANADRRVLDHLLESDFVPYFVVERPENCPPLCRDRSNNVYNAYNNLFADTRLLDAYVRAEGRVDTSRPDLSGTRFEATVPPGGLPGASLSINYSPQSYHRWEYDAGTGRYVRWQETQDIQDQGGAFALLNDRLTGQPITADNVILLFVPHLYYSEEPEILTMQLWGYGPAYVFRNGKVFNVAWQRVAQERPLTMIYPNGDPFPLKPGRAFFQVIGQSSRSWQFGENWRFDFAIP